MDRIKKYLKQYTDQLVFITLENYITQSKKDIGFLKDIPLPVAVHRIADHINEGNQDQIPFEAFVEGIIHVMGVDKDFKYIHEYQKFLFMSNEQITDYILYHGLKKAEEGKYLDAIIYFRAVLSMEENNLSAFYNYGKCCRDIFDMSKDIKEKKDFKSEAIKIFETITEFFPEFPASYYYLGFFYFNQKLFEKAQITWKKYLEISDDQEKKEEIDNNLRRMENHVLFEKGYNNILSGRFEKGLEILLPLEKKYPQWWNLLFFIGLAYRNMEEFEKAIDYFKKVLQNKPSQIDTMNELGICYTSVNDFNNAEKYFKKALMLKKNDHEILSNLAVVYMNTGNINEAEECLVKALKISPEDEVALLWMEKLKEIRNKTH